MRAAQVLIAAIGLALAAAPAAAQAEPGRFQINVDAGVQLSTTSFDTTTTRALYLENATIATSYPVGRGLLVDGGASVRLIGRFSVGVLVSSFTTARDGEVSASLPHPFFFRAPRTVTGTASDLHREELAAHLQGIYTLRPHDTIDVALSAGPSYLRLRQDVVTDITFTDTYPYDTAGFTSAASQRVGDHGWGFNAGADVSIRLARHAGIGGGVRYSHAVVKLAVPSGGGTVSIDAGGAGVAGGLRLYF